MRLAYVFAAFLFSLSMPVHAHFELCNRSSETLKMAWGHSGRLEKGKLVFRDGWPLTLLPNHCRIVDANPMVHTYYYYAEGVTTQNVWGGKDMQGCLMVMLRTCIPLNMKKLNSGTETQYKLALKDKPLQKIETAVIQRKCLARWDDSHQVHSSEFEVTSDYQAWRTRMKKLEHCIRIDVIGPIDIGGIADTYVNYCVNKALNSDLVLHGLKLIAAIAGDLAAAGGTGGALTIATAVDYGRSVGTETLKCLTDANQAVDVIGKRLSAAFKASIHEESHWVYWDL